ncbi:MAG: hypothetical protein J0I42_07355 [Bosea sp.]|nr:hypothetical protein [Bosea sp. (in: a-proteobacteria)]
MPGYRLPGRDLRVTITEAAGGGFAVTKISPVPMGRGPVQCLDYVSLATSNDQLVAKISTTGLLQSIGTVAEDQSVEIAKKLIETGKNVAIAAGARNATLGRKLAPPEPLSFDPFDPLAYGRIKTALRDYGLCIVVEGVHVPVGGAGAEAYCDRRGSPSFMPEAETARLQPVPQAEAARGVLYRPLLTHMVTVLRKADPYGRGAWSLHQREAHAFPDLAPVVSIGVERAAFATRTTQLKFDDGVLTDVSVDKKSELLGLSQIPLDFARAVVDIPGQIITLRIIQASQESKLLVAQSDKIKAQGDLIAAQTAFMLARQRALAPEAQRDATVEPSRSASGRSALANHAMETFVNSCIDNGTASDKCLERWQNESR